MFYSIGYLVGFFFLLGMGVFVGFTGPRRPPARLWSLLSFLVADWLLGRFMILHSSTAEQAFLWQRIMYVGAIYLNVVYYHFVLAFVEEKGMRWFLYVGYTIATVLTAANLTSHLFVRTMLEGTVFHFYEHVGPWYLIHVAIYCLYPGMGVLLLLQERRRADPARKNQIDYILWASLIGFVCGATTFPLIFGIKFPPVGGPFVPLYAFIITYAIVKHRLMDIHVVIRRTLIYSIVSATLTSVYVGTMTLLARLFEMYWPTSSTLTSTLATGGFGLHWLKNTIQASFGYSCMAISIFSMGFGILVWLKGRRKPVNVLWGLTCITVGLWSLGQGVSACASDFTTAYFWVRWFQHGGSILIPIIFLHFVICLLKVRTRFVLWFGYTAAGLLEWLNVSGHLMSLQPVPPFRYYTLPLRLYGVFAVYFFSLVIYAHWLLYREMRFADGQLKNQIKYIFLGTSIGFLGGSTTFLLAFNIPIFPYGVYAIPAYIVGVSYAIFKHQLMDINVVIRKTLLYSLVSAALAAVYVGTITLAAHVLGGRHGSTSAVSSTLAAIFITLLFNPLRNRLQVFIDNKFARSRLVGTDQFVKLSSEVIGHENLEKIADSVGRILEEAVRPQVWALYLRSTDDREFVKMISAHAEGLPENMPLVNDWSNYFLNIVQTNALELANVPLNDIRSNGVLIAVAVPLMGGRDLLGYLLLGEKKSEEPYSEEDQILMRMVANQAAVAFERTQMAQRISGAFVHEIKMPLANIALPAELTFMDMDDLDQGKKSAQELIPRIKKRMKYIMDQALLAGTRVDAVREAAGTDELLQGKADLRQILESSLQQMESLLRQTHVEVSKDIPDSLALISGSARQLEIVFRNLIKNAAEAMATSSAPRELRIRAGEENGQVVTCVQDTGPGINAAHRPYLFTSRYSTKGSQGSGVGLFLSRQIIEAHGGTIEAQSQNGRGAEFVIRLPKSS